MPKDYAALAKEAAALTNKQLASEIAGITRLSPDDLEKLIPLKRDRVEFVELMRLVQKETDDDKAAAKVANDITRFGKVVVQALRYFT